MLHLKLSQTDPKKVHSSVEDLVALEVGCWIHDFYREIFSVFFFLQVYWFSGQNLQSRHFKDNFRFPFLEDYNVIYTVFAISSGILRYRVDFQSMEYQGDPLEDYDDEEY